MPKNPDGPRPKPPIGDPPKPKRRVKAEAWMTDPLTEQTTHRARPGEGVNRVQPKHSAPGENAEDAMPVEEGFSPIP